MYSKDFWKKIISFVISFTIGFLATDVISLSKINLAKKKSEKTFVNNIEVIKESGFGHCAGAFSLDNQKNYVDPNLEQKALQVLSKPQPRYTDSARQKNIEGTVVLKIIFLKTGRIGEVSNVTGLPEGLTERAISAAKKIKFNPVIRNGRPITISKTVVYKFAL